MSDRKVDVFKETVRATSGMVGAFSTDRIYPRISMITCLADLPPLATVCRLTLVAVVLIVPMATP